MAEPLLRVQELKKYFPLRSGLFRRREESVKAVDGVTFDIVCKASPWFIEFCEINQAILAEVNINLNIVLVPASEQWAMVSEGKIDFARTSWRPTPDPHMNLEALFSERGTYTHMWGYSNPEVDRLLAEAGGIYDTVKAKLLYDQVHTLVAEDAVFVYLIWAKEFTAVRTNVQGFEGIPDLDLRVHNLWLKK